MTFEHVQFKRPGRADQAALVRRAAVAFLQEQEGEDVLLPSAGVVRILDGLGYAVLSDASGVLAVYRIRPDNMALRRLKRWPDNLEG